jgi:uncharacterized membrane protein
LLAVGALDWVRRYPLLPARMASHFGPPGEVTNWQSKEQFFMTMVVVMGVSFVAGFVVPQLIGVLPANMVNLPHKEYWLAAERCEETMRYLSLKMGWFACAVLFLLLFVTSEAINANMPSHGQFAIGATFAVLFGFVAFMGIWTILLLRHFNRIPEPAFPEETERIVNPLSPGFTVL